MPPILHIDLDAFFASCEKKRNPELEDQAVVICMYSGRGKDSGAVSAAGYGAREYGIHAGMPVSEARNRAEQAGEDIAFLAADKDFYGEVSRRIMGIVEEEAAEVEKASVDEAYADLPAVGSYQEARERAERLKQRIKAEEGLTASIGVAPNKLVAKMASDRDKPDGLTVVEPGEVEEFLTGMEVDELHGVGPKTAERLEEFGVRTVEELREVSRARLVEAFGEKRGVSLHRKAAGNGETKLEEQEQEQLSRLTTLGENTRELEEMAPVVEQLAEDVIQSLEDRGWRYSTVTALVITTDMDMRTRSRSFKTAERSLERFQDTALELLEDFLQENPDAVVRRVGVRASGFDKGGQRSLSDF